MKKILSLLLSLAMMVTYMPMTAFAADEQNIEAQQTVAQENAIEDVEQEAVAEKEVEVEGVRDTNILQVNIVENEGVTEPGYFALFENGEASTEQYDEQIQGYDFDDKEEVVVKFRPKDNYWLDTIVVGDNGEDYKLNPKEGEKSLDEIGSWDEEADQDGHVWFSINVNFTKYFEEHPEADRVYIEALFQSYGGDGPAYKANKCQVFYDDLYGDRGYVEVSKNKSAWEKIQAGDSISYTTKDVLKFRICSPRDENPEDVKDLPAVEVSETSGEFVYSDEGDDNLNVGGNTFTYRPKTNNGINVRVWWSVYGHEYDFAWAEEDMSKYFLILTDIIDGAGLVGFDDSFYGSSNLAMVDNKAKARIKTGSSTNVKIEPDNGNEVDYVLLDGNRIEGKNLGTTTGFTKYTSTSQKTTSYRYKASKKTELYVAFRERTDWEKAAEKLKTDKFAYASNNPDQFKTLLANEMFNKRLSNAFASADEVEGSLQVSKVNDNGGIAEKGQYSYTLSKDGTIVKGTADVLENPTDVVVAFASEEKIVKLSDIDGHKFYTVRIPYDQKKRDISIYGNGVKVSYEYEQEDNRIGYEISNKAIVDSGVIDNTLTIYNDNYKGNEFDKFSCNSDEQQVRCNVLNNGEGNSTIRPVGIEDSKIFEIKDGETSAFKANVAKNNDVTFEASLKDGDKLEAVYVGKDNVTSSIQDGKFTVSKGNLDEVINVFINKDNPGPGHLVLVHFKNYGAENTNVSIGDSAKNVNQIRQPNGDNTKETEYTTLVRLPGPDYGQTVYLKLGVGFPHIFTNIIVNGKKVENIPATRQERIDNFSQHQNNVPITISKTDDNYYDITAFTRAGKKEEGNDELFFGNFGWFTSGASDDSIQGGKIDLVKAVYKEAGQKDDVYYDENDESHSQLDNESAKFWDVHEDGSGGEAGFPSGTEVTVRLTPDYGKQLVSFGVNGKHFDKGDQGEANEYTFIVGSGNFHLYAKFEDVDNTTSIDKSVDNLRDASVEFTSNTNPVDAGTLNMKINESEQKADDSNAITAYDINMDNVFYAGKRKVNKDWTDENMPELDAQATINMLVDDIDVGDEVRVIREHDGKEDTVYNGTIATADGSVEFNSKLFSTYTICRDSMKPGSFGTVTCSSPTYAGKGTKNNRTPSVVVKNSHGRILKAGEDYTISYPSSRYNVGKYTITVKGVAGTRYAGKTKKVSFKIIPKGATIKTPSKGKKYFVAKWSKQTAKMSKKRITGYEVQYSTSSTFKSAKTKKVKGYKKSSVKIKGSAKKKYYVRVRTYLGSYKSNWSSVKSVTTK